MILVHVHGKLSRNEENESKRIIDFVDWQEDVKLPSRVTVELRPRNNMAWWRVQASSMNPRVRTLLPIQRRLSSLLIFLQQRWQPSKYKTVSFLSSHRRFTRNYFNCVRRTVISFSFLFFFFHETKYPPINENKSLHEKFHSISIQRT